MADEFDDRMRQVFRDAASDAPRAQPLPAMIPVTSTRLRSTSGRRTLLAMAAGLLLVVGVGAAVLLRGDDPRIVPPVGTADVTTTAPSPTTSSSGASADVRPCATTDLRFAVRTSSLVVDGDARPLLNLTNIGEGTCVVDESLFLVFRDGDIARAGRRTEALELPSNPTGSPAFGGSMSLTFASICPEPGEFGQPVFDTLTARIGDGPTARIPLIGGECSTSPATCELDQLDASINDDHQFVLLNNSGRQCEVTVRDILFLRFDGVVQRAAGPGRAG